MVDESRVKDPMQIERMPHEILGIDRGAKKADIDRAMIVALRTSVPANTAKNARDALLDPLKRAWYDLLQYDRRRLGNFAPSTVEAPAVFGRVNRAATARKWKKISKSKFPNLDMVHSLAVLWYWWSMYEEQRIDEMLKKITLDHSLHQSVISRNVLLQHIRRSKGVSCDPHQSKRCRVADCPWCDDCLSSSPPMKEMWERVIGYWVMLTASPSFWNRSFGLAGKDARALREQLIGTLRDVLHDLALRYDKHQAYGNAEQYRALDLALSAELQSAESLKRVGMRTKYGKVSCGVLMLTHMGILKAARLEVEAALKKCPSNRELKRLRNVLSPYLSVAILVDQKKPRAALDIIGKIPAEEQQCKEIQTFRLLAFHMLGKQMASLDDMNGAINAWRSALESDCEEELNSEIRVEIIKMCSQKALALQNRRRDEAIALLDEAVKFVPDEKLRLVLAELLMQRGVENFCNTRDKMELAENVDNEFIQILEACLKDIEKAVELGSKAAIQQAGDGREYLGVYLANRGVDRVKQAERLASTKTTKPNREIISLLKAAESDLVKATRYVPNSQSTKRYLRKARMMLADLNEPTSKADELTKSDEF